jgi:hypothetical protein
MRAHLNLENLSLREKTKLKNFKGLPRRSIYSLSIPIIPEQFFT